MSTICFYFQVHQPYRIKKYRVFDIGHDNNYFDNHQEAKTDNSKILQKVISKCYLPANKLLLKLLDKYPEFRISFSFSGVFLQQIAKEAPEVLQSFRDLVNTGRCEILAETFYHSLASIYSKEEFTEQVRLHSSLVSQLFFVRPKVFRNTELIYSNDIAKTAEQMGFEGILTEGVDRVLEGRSPNQLFSPKDCKSIVALLKNYQLSDDIAFRFSDQNWNEFPLTAHKFTDWIAKVEDNSVVKDPIINLFMDYETFGEHQWEHSGIFGFLEHLPAAFLANSNNSFATPSEVINRFGHKATKVETMEAYAPGPKLPAKPLVIANATSVRIQSPVPYLSSRKKIFFKRSKPNSEKVYLPELDVPDYISWADSERDLSAWRSNQMQHEALEKIFEFEKRVKKLHDKELLEDWRKLTTSDHFYYMCTKYWSDGDVHKYFSPYESPYEAFIYYMNVLKDLEMRVEKLEKLEANLQQG
jgi:alpha-amylase